VCMGMECTWEHVHGSDISIYATIAEGATFSEDNESCIWEHYVAYTNVALPYTCSHIHYVPMYTSMLRCQPQAQRIMGRVYGNIMYMGTSVWERNITICNDCCERSEDNESRVWEHHVYGNILMGSQYLQLLLEYDVFRGQWDVCMGP